MRSASRRALLRGSLGLAAGALARPFVANAAATTITTWWMQGFIPEEDASLKAMIADYEKQSGNTIDLTILPFAAMRQKEIAAVITGVVPDIINLGDYFFGVLAAWKDQLEDVSDVIETQKALFTPTSLASVYAYNNAKKKRSYYMIPHRMGVVPFHGWKSLIEKSGFKISDIPKTWDAFIDFFGPVQTKLRAQGMRNIYALCFQVGTAGFDPIFTFDHFLLAYGGKNFVTPDGKLHTGDPQVREAAVKAMAKLAEPYKDGRMPPQVLNWNDNDDNNAFHAKLVVMDFDGSLSTEVALWHDKDQYNDVLTMGLPLSNQGRPVPSVAGPTAAVIPKGAKNVAAAKEFLKYSIQPKVLAAYLKSALGRFLPPMPSIVKSDEAFWLDPKNEPLYAYTKQGMFGPTVPWFEVYNPARAQVSTEHVFSVALVDVMTKGVAPEAAVDKAFKRCEAIFAAYPIQEG